MTADLQDFADEYRRHLAAVADLKRLRANALLWRRSIRGALQDAGIFLVADADSPENHEVFSILTGAEQAATEEIHALDDRLLQAARIHDAMAEIAASLGVELDGLEQGHA